MTLLNKTLIKKSHPNILVLCGRNKRRSKTAEYIFKNDQRINIRSAGLSQQSQRKVTESDLNWADLVLVMEKEHREKIVEIYEHISLPPIEILNIADEYEFLEEELVEMLEERINDILTNMYNL
jgi:predicted protein tyrosine phosphatase